MVYVYIINAMLSKFGVKRKYIESEFTIIEVSPHIQTSKYNAMAETFDFANDSRL